MDDWANQYVRQQQSAMRGGKRITRNEIRADIRKAHPPRSAIISIGYLVWLAWWAARIWWAIHCTEGNVQDWSKVIVDDEET